MRHQSLAVHPTFLRAFLAALAAFLSTLASCLIWALLSKPPEAAAAAAPPRGRGGGGGKCWGCVCCVPANAMHSPRHAKPMDSKLFQTPEISVQQPSVVWLL
eukprot:307907-Pelagomonas_calceolata.AAC.4